MLDQLKYHLELEWIYQPDAVAEIQTITELIIEADMLVPTEEELSALCQAAIAGYVVEIQNEAKQRIQLDERYIAFTDKVLQFAQAFEDEAIVKLIYLVATNKIAP